MRVVHLADLHLGFRQFQRTTNGGTNVREADVARAFRDAIEQTIAIAPELVVIAGDVFHASRPPNNAIIHAQRQFARLRIALPETVVVVVAGNHDVPRSTDTGNILTLFEDLGVHVAATKARRITVPSLGLSVLAVPDVFGATPVLDPEPTARYNVLVLHGEVEFVAPNATPRWDYVALGHYHVQREVAARTFYAGSLDYTSSNPWGELVEERERAIAGKGFIVADLDMRTQATVPVPAARTFVDLPPIDGREKSAAEVDALIAAAVNACDGGIADKVVRLVVHDIERPVLRALDQKPLREYRSRALHFQLVTHKPVTITAGTSVTPRRRLPSLVELVRESLAKRYADPEDRSAITALAEKYLGEAEAAEETESLLEAPAA